MERKTVLYDRHTALGARMVPFGGYLMPVQYTGILEEHAAVRTKAGLFDVSHMGEVLLEGPDALRELNRVLTNDFTSMKDGRVRYSPMCYPDGGVVDDLLVYRRGPERYLIVVNASNREKDVEWMKAHWEGDVRFEDISDRVAEIALQGPLSEEILRKLTEGPLPDKYYWFTEDVSVAGIRCLVSRTGYTGEDGFELYCAAADGPALWDALLAAGRPMGLIPCGLGARDTLRLEAAMPLYGHEMDETISPLETGLGSAVKMEKEDFIGKEGILKRGEPKTVRVGLKVTGRGVVREHMEVLDGGEVIGHTTSGTVLPTVGGAHAMALLPPRYAAPGIPVTVNVRGREVACETEALPFYRRAR